VIDRGLHGYPFTGFWVDAGTPESYLEATRAVLERESTKSHAGAKIIPPVLIDPSANLKGCRLGPNVVVGPDTNLWGCEATGTILMEGVQGMGARLEGCLVGPRVRLEGHHQRKVLSQDGETTY